ncbi:hypothetical protein LEC15_21920, partial [Salmonella enterica]|nr:hypothetical protein [Salmonella enterica]MDJ6193717.1 hypothetical protein [Salmonella enterica]
MMFIRRFTDKKLSTYIRTSQLITPNEWDRRLVSGQDHFPLRVIFLHCQSEGGAQMRFCVHEWHG